MIHHVNTTCQSHIWSSALDHLKSNCAQRLSTSHYKAPLQLPSMTMLAGITIHWSITTSPSVILVPCITMSVLSEEQRRRLEKKTTKLEILKPKRFIILSCSQLTYVIISRSALSIELFPKCKMREMQATHKLRHEVEGETRIVLILFLSFSVIAKRRL